MIVRHDALRRLLAAGLLVTLAACTTAKLETPEAPGVNPNEIGKTNDPAAGFANAGPGSEEDFILNVGRRTFFASGSAELDSVARATLDKQAAFMQQNPRWLMKLQGFADDPGSESAQVALSQKRADAVMRYIASKGVDPKRMWAKGYGKDRLVRACTDTACRVQNRRVVSNLRNEYDAP
jgi:outer membrane protein OmpA-like peptidoglycan-associated protein